MNKKNTSSNFRQFAVASFLKLLTLATIFSPICVPAGLAPDKTFDPSTFATSNLPAAALLLADGKYFLFSNPDTLTDQPAGALTRYLPDGTLDASFAFSRDYKNVTAVAPAGDGKFYVAATRLIYGVKEGDFILRINADGGMDPTFTPSVAGRDSSEIVRNLLVQPDGKILVMGFFVSFNGDSTKKFLVRLLNDGSVDSGFAAQPNDDVYSAALQSDGKIVIAGIFQGGNGVLRLNTNGSFDNSFAGAGFTRLTANRSVVIQPDGMVVVAGNFRIGSGGAARRMPIVRLTTTGAFDTTFDASGLNAFTYLGRAIVLQPDGKIVAAMSAS